VHPPGAPEPDVDETTRQVIPSKVQTIGVLHLVGGIMNLLVAIGWLFYGLVFGIATFGVGLVACCPAFLLLPLGIVEIVSGAKHLSRDHRGLGAPRLTAIAEICGVLGCSLLSMVFGILTLVFLSDPEVDDYYNQNLLSG
jgi:hypothetical protein